MAAIAAAGAASVTPLPLHLRPGAREWYGQWLAREHPDLLPRYRELYRGGSYSDRGYQRELIARVRAVARRHGLIGDPAHRAVDDGGEPARRRPAEVAEQPTLW